MGPLWPIRCHLWPDRDPCGLIGRSCGPADQRGVCGPIECTFGPTGGPFGPSLFPCGPTESPCGPSGCLCGLIWGLCGLIGGICILTGGPCGHAWPITQSVDSCLYMDHQASASHGSTFPFPWGNALIRESNFRKVSS